MSTVLWIILAFAIGVVLFGIVGLILVRILMSKEDNVVRHANLRTRSKSDRQIFQNPTSKEANSSTVQSKSSESNPANTTAKTSQTQTKDNNPKKP